MTEELIIYGNGNEVVITAAGATSTVRNDTTIEINIYADCSLTAMWP